METFDLIKLAFEGNASCCVTYDWFKLFKKS